MYKKIVGVAAFFIGAFISLTIAPSTFAASYTLSGKVMDSNSHPLGNAQLTFYDQATNQGVGGPTSNIIDGTYSLSVPTGTYKVFALTFNGAYQQKEIDNILVSSDTKLDIILDPKVGSVALQGHLLSPQSEPVNGAEISLTSPSQEGQTVFTDAQGNYFLRVLQGNNYQIQIADSRSTAESGVDVPQAFNIKGGFSIVLTQDTTQDIVLPTANVTVFVKDPSGNPMQNVSSSTDNPNSTISTQFSLQGLGDVQGTFSDSGGLAQSQFTNSNGTMVLRLLPTGSANSTIIQVYPQNSSTYYDTRMTNVTVIDGITVPITLSTQPTVRGYISDGIFGTGLQNQAITISQNGVDIFSTTTDANGFYYTKIPIGTNYTFTVQSNGTLLPKEPTTYKISGTFDVIGSRTVNISLPNQLVNVITKDAVTNNFLPAHVTATIPEINLSIRDLQNAVGFATDQVDTDSNTVARMVLFNTTFSAANSGYTITTIPTDTQYAQSSLLNVAISGNADEYISVNLNPTPTPTPTNLAPVVNPIANTTINQGDKYLTSGSFTDPDSTSWTSTVDYGDGSGLQSLTLNADNSFSLSHVYAIPGSYVVTVSVTDNQLAIGTSTTTVTVNNVAPSVGAITAPTDPQIVNTTIATSANFTDPGIVDTHTALWNWGDGTTSAGAVTETNGSGSVTNTHAYTTSGVYPVTLTITDNHAGIGTAIYQYVVVYDPSAGYVTGSGSFDTPAGSNPANTLFIGKTHFGFNAKYKKDGSLDGKTKMDWKPKALDIDLDSLNYQWLVVNGNKAQFKGTGKLMDQGSYTFLITVIDGGANSPDKLRIKIINNTDNSVVYDTQMGTPDSADPTMSISKGQIKIHS